MMCSDWSIPDGVREVMKIHVHISRIVEHSPDDIQGGVGEVDIKLKRKLLLNIKSFLLKGRH